VNHLSLFLVLLYFEELPMTAQPHDTRSRLLSSAIDLFSQNWYASVSVANICRQAKLSNGIFYRYFKDKESIFREILERTINEITELLEGCNAPSLHERLEKTVYGLTKYAKDNKKLIRVYREGQYHFFEYEKKLTLVYEACLTRILGTKVSHARYLFAIGGLRFASIRAALYDVSISLPALCAIIENGLFPDMSFDEQKIFNIKIDPLPLSMNENTEKRLLAAGKKLFGEQGFHKVNIHDITDAAGYSVGAFYKYFDSKERYFERLIDDAGHDVRKFIASNLSPGLNRLEQELQGMFLFATFLSIDKWVYNIVREGEFIAPQKAREYYASFADAYRKNTKPALPQTPASQLDNYETTAIEFLLGIPHYFGLDMIFEQSQHNARLLIKEIGYCLAHGLEAPTQVR